MLLFFQSGRFPAEEIIKNKRLAQSDNVLKFRLTLDYLDYMALYCNHYIPYIFYRFKS